MEHKYDRVAEIKNGAQILFEKGPARLEENGRKQRGFDDYYHNVLLPLMGKVMNKKGQIMKPDDLKLRYSESRNDDYGQLIISAGPSSWYEYRDAYLEEGDLPDLEKIVKLKAEGEKAVGDEWARLGRPLGLTAIVLDTSGSFILAERAPPKDRGGVTEYIHWWHGPAGYLTFEEDPTKISIPKTALWFVKRDYGITQDRVDKMAPKLIVAQPDSGETDIVVVVWTNVSKGEKLKLSPKFNQAVPPAYVAKGEAADFISSHDLVYPSEAGLKLKL